MSWLSSVFNAAESVVTGIGGAIGDAVTGDFKGAGDSLAKGFTGLVKGIPSAAKVAAVAYGGYTLGSSISALAMPTTAAASATPIEASTGIPALQSVAEPVITDTGISETAPALLTAGGETVSSTVASGVSSSVLSGIAAGGVSGLLSSVGNKVISAGNSILGQQASDYVKSLLGGQPTPVVATSGNPGFILDNSGGGGTFPQASTSSAFPWSTVVGIAVFGIAGLLLFSLMRKR